VAAYLENCRGVIQVGTEAGVRMGTSPKGKQWRAGQCGEVHVGRIYADHQVEEAHERDLLVHIKHASNDSAPCGEGLPDFFKESTLFASSSEEKEMTSPPFLHQVDQSAYIIPRPYFCAVIGKGRNPDPFLHAGCKSVSNEPLAHVGDGIFVGYEE